ncbi:MAG: hypothetical protein DDT21_02312 [Syntrophomonadaceae bacterium]|nr:hypothetical protein [Bacillota bacterium]
MREQIEVKLKQAQEQQAQWQQRLAQAQEQVLRWDAIRLFCQELLAADAQVVGEVVAGGG